MTALRTIEIARNLVLVDAYDEANPINVETLVMAALTLLIYELGPEQPDDAGSRELKRASAVANTLLIILAKYNNTAVQCLESLTVSCDRTSDGIWDWVRERD